MSIVAVPVALGISVVLIAGTGTALAAPAPSAMNSVSRSAFAIHTVNRHVVAAPVIRPGRVHVRNTGGHPIMLLSPRHSAGVAALVRDLKGDTPAQLLRDFGVRDMISAHRDVYLKLRRGTLYLLDETVTDYTAAKVTITRVAGTYVNAAVLHPKYAGVAANLTINAPATVTQKRYVRVANSSSRLQEVLLLPVGKNVTRAQLNKFLADPSFDDLFEVSPLFDAIVLAFLSPGRVVSTRVGVRPGRHLILSFSFPLNGTDDGTPVLKRGQVRLITVLA
jgi:hypothetical protein